MDGRGNTRTAVSSWPTMATGSRNGVVEGWYAVGGWEKSKSRFTKKRGLDQVGGTGETGQAHGATNLKASTTPVTGGEARRWNSGSGPG